MTGEYVHEYFDPDHAGWRGVTTTDIVSLSLTATVFFLQRGVHALREQPAWKADYPSIVIHVWTKAHMLEA